MSAFEGKADMVDARTSPPLERLSRISLRRLTHFHAGSSRSWGIYGREIASACCHEAANFRNGPCLSHLLEELTMFKFSLRFTGASVFIGC